MRLALLTAALLLAGQAWGAADVAVLIMRDLGASCVPMAEGYLSGVLTSQVNSGCKANHGGNNNRRLNHHRMGDATHQQPPPQRELTGPDCTICEQNPAFCMVYGICGYRRRRRVQEEKPNHSRRRETTSNSTTTANATAILADLELFGAQLESVGFTMEIYSVPFPPFGCLSALSTGDVRVYCRASS